MLGHGWILIFTMSEVGAKISAEFLLISTSQHSEEHNMVLNFRRHCSGYICHFSLNICAPDLSPNLEVFIDLEANLVVVKAFFAACPALTAVSAPPRACSSSFGLVGDESVNTQVSQLAKQGLTGVPILQSKAI